MSKEAVCCEKCFGLIARKSTTAARLWITLCDVELLYGNHFGVDACDWASLRQLELLGFVLTTEAASTEHAVLVRVDGKQSDEEGVYFCGGRCE